ncbi:ATP-binding cassette domain-containing protein, partial [Clostridioides difficile]
AFLFVDEEVFKKISTLSGGERARVAILKLILSNANLLLLDEPTNHLDIDSKEVLEEALTNYDGTIFTISHDRYFLNTVVDKILVLDENGITEYLGNYDYYIDKKRQIQEMSIIEEKEEKTRTQIKDEKRKEREQREIEKKNRIKRQNIEKEIEKLEIEIEKLDILLCQEEVYSNPDKAKEVSQEKINLENNLASLYDEWEEFM